MSLVPVRDLEESDWRVYTQSAEIHAAVHALYDFSDLYHKRRLVSGEDVARRELFANLIRFFVEYDRIRDGQVQLLKADLTELLMRTRVSSNTKSLKCSKI